MLECKKAAFDRNFLWKFIFCKSIFFQSHSAAGQGSAWDPNAWKQECLALVQELLNSDDSVPFRQPVDLDEVPVSYKHIFVSFEKNSHCFVSHLKINGSGFEYEKLTLKYT